MKILLLGASGQLGQTLIPYLEQAGDLVTSARQGADEGLDLAHRGQASALIKKLAPDVIVNAAAYTQVEQAEQESEQAFAINRDGVAEVADAARAVGARLIHFSTDFVFDGRAAPYSETDTPAPLNVYGQSKLEGEQAISTSGCHHWIFRTSWVYNFKGNNFFNTMLRLAAERDALQVINDQRGTPTWTHTIARVVRRSLAEKGLADGIYHLCDDGSSSWYDFAREIFRLNGVPIKLTPIGQDAWPSKVERPADSRLITEKLQAALGWQPQSWQESLAECVAMKRETAGNA